MQIRRLCRHPGKGANTSRTSRLRYQSLCEVVDQQWSRGSNWKRSGHFTVYEIFRMQQSLYGGLLPQQRHFEGKCCPFSTLGCCFKDTEKFENTPSKCSCCIVHLPLGPSSYTYAHSHVRNTMKYLSVLYHRDFHSYSFLSICRAKLIQTYQLKAFIAEEMSQKQATLSQPFRFVSESSIKRSGKFYGGGIAESPDKEKCPFRIRGGSVV